MNLCMRLLNYIVCLSRYSMRPVLSQAGLYDPTTIFESEKIVWCQRESWAKLVIYILVFFFSLAG